jgi:protein SCO1/2
MGVSYPPRDVRLGLVEASAGRIGSAADRVLLLCFRYDPASGKYTLAVWRILRVASVLTVAGMVLLLVVLSRRRFRGRATRAPTLPSAPEGA